jgi:hypothetical protein
MRFSKAHIANMAAKQDNIVPPSAADGVQRLSSMTATEEDVSARGPVVVVPPRLLTGKRTQASSRGFAVSLEQAREELATVDLEEDPFASPASVTPATTPGSPITPTDVPPEDSFAFAFDIDGVLIRGGNPIPEAIEAMKVLNGQNEFGVRM